MIVQLLIIEVCLAQEIFVLYSNTNSSTYSKHQSLDGMYIVYICTFDKTK